MSGAQKYTNKHRKHQRVKETNSWPAYVQRVNYRAEPAGRRWRSSGSGRCWGFQPAPPAQTHTRRARTDRRTAAGHRSRLTPPAKHTRTHRVKHPGTNSSSGVMPFWFGFSRSCSRFPGGRMPRSGSGVASAVMRSSPPRASGAAPRSAPSSRLCSPAPPATET